MSKSLLKPMALLCAMGCFPLAHAASPTELQDQLVTATRTAQTVQESLAAVTVFDRAQIEQSQAASLPELLQKVPGVSFSNNGGPGKNTALYMRGSNANHVLVLIDGLRVGSVSSGGAALQDLPLELIERVEVVRGPRSSLYGSEAIGGVIQIFIENGQELRCGKFGFIEDFFVEHTGGIERFQKAFLRGFERLCGQWNVFEQTFYRQRIFLRRGVLGL